MQLTGKVAFITGSARGLGKEYASALLEHGAKVCLSDVLKEQAEKTLAEFQSKYGKDKVLCVACDVTRGEDFRDAFASAVTHFGRIDIMVNNAGILDETQFERTVDINLNGVIRGTNIALEHMRRDKGGKGGVVVNVASSAGLVPFWPMPVYDATKHAVVGLTRSWAANPGQKEQLGVRFVTLCPNFTDTAILDNTPDTCLDCDAFNSMAQGAGIMTREHVAEEFIKLLQNEGNNGGVLLVMKDETSYWEFPSK